MVKKLSHHSVTMDSNADTPFFFGYGGSSRTGETDYAVFSVLCVPSHQGRLPLR
jgi:hypothetical protein